MTSYYDVQVTTEWIGSGRKGDGWRVAVPTDDNAAKLGDLMDAIRAANEWACHHGWVYQMTTARKILHRRPPSAMSYDDFRGAVI